MKAPWEFDRPLCSEIGSLPFFPETDDVRGRDTATLAMTVAKQLCQRCDHIKECLEWAVETDEAYGIWGGTAPHERRAIKRQRSKSRRATVNN